MERTAKTDTFIKPLFVGAVAGIGATYLLGNEPIPALGGNWSPAMLIGGAAAGGSIVSGLTHNYVLKMIPGTNAKYSAVSGQVLGPVLTGASTYGIMALATGSPLSLAAAMELTALGAASHVAGDYAYGVLYPVYSQPGYRTGY